MYESDKFTGRYRISSVRAIWHKYDEGVYFVTVCTYNREHYFGKITDGKMYLTEIGQFADQQIRNVEMHYPYAAIPLWVVMPNHIHAIVSIDGNKTPQSDLETSSRWKTSFVDKQMQFVSHRRGWLSTTIGGLKRAVSRYAHERGIQFAWQARFHDHIIRNNDEMDRIATYIINNVSRWETDR